MKFAPWLAVGAALVTMVWVWAAFLRASVVNLILQPVVAGVAVAVFFAGLWWAAARLLGSWGDIPPAEARGRSAFCLGAFLLLFFFLPDYLIGQAPTFLQSTLLLAVVGLLFLVFLWFSLPRGTQNLHSFSAAERRAKIMLLVPLLVYFGGCSYLALQKLHVFGYVGQDLAYFSQCFYTTLQGYLFYGNLLQDLLYSQPVTSDFAGHNSPLMAIFLPFYYLYPSPATLLIVRNVFMVLCVWPVYLIGREKFSPGVSVTLAMTFLLLPSIFFQNLFGFYPLSLAAFFLLFTFYFYLHRQSKWFFAFCLLTLLVREDLVFAVFCFGMLALWQRRERLWALGPMLLAMAWGGLSFGVVLPHFLGEAPMLANVCFAHVGSTRVEMVLNMISNPGEVFFLRGNLIYLKELITPFAWVLSLGNPIALFAVPYLGINLLGGGGPCITTLIHTQYSVIPSVILFVALVGIVDKIGTGLGRRGMDASRVQAAIAAFLLGLTVATIIFVTDPAQFDEFREQPWHAEARKVARLVPPEASVAAPRYMLPSLSNRMALYQSHRLFDYHHPDPEYIIMDRDWTRIIAAERWREDYEELLSQLEFHPGFRAIYESPDFVVYRRRSPSSGVLKRLSRGVGHE